MARISDQSIQAVRDGADLVDLVRGRVNLTKRGTRWVGRCPFHDERTPSFSLLPPDARRYYCHGCGATGDAFDWMQTQEGAASFTDAVVALAERFGIDVQFQEESAVEQAHRAANDRRLELLDRAATFYSQYLWRAPDAEPARRYLEERKIERALLERFRVGFAPSSGRALQDRAATQGYGGADLVDAGLARAAGGRGAGDFFVGRITFPIADARGRVQGFGARTLDPTERAKYVNSPEGPNFRKRDLLFGLSEARPSGARSGSMVVVEGYTDVLGMVAAGVENVVACMGTSLTPAQLRLVRRWAGEVALCFDGDSAGQRAAWRSVEAADGVPIHFSAVALPPGRDPGDMATTPEGRAQLAAAVEGAVPLVAVLIRAKVASAGPSAAEREQVLEEVAGLLRHFPDSSVEKEDALRLTESLMDLSPGLTGRLRRSSQPTGGTTRRPGPEDAPPGPVLGPARGAQEIRERRLLAGALAQPTVAAGLLEGLSADAFGHPGHRRAFELLRGGHHDPEQWPEDCGQVAIALRVELADGTPSHDEMREAAYRLELPLVRRRAIELRASGDIAGWQRVNALEQRINAALRGAP